MDREFLAVIQDVRGVSIPLSCLEMTVRLDSPIQYVKGVGPKKASMLAKAGIRSIEDMLNYQPFRYEDRTNYRVVRDLVPDREAVVKAEIVITGGYTTPMKKVRIFEMIVRDQSGAMTVKFFNQPYLDKVFRKGLQVVLFGAPRVDEYSQGLSFFNPEFEILQEADNESVHTGRIVPVYRKIGQILTRTLRQITHQILSGLSANDVPESLSAEVLARYAFPSRLQALRGIHFPECPREANRESFLEQLAEGWTPAQQRLIFEEFFLFQLGLKVLRSQRKLITKSRSIQVNPQIREVLKSILPFHPTRAQKRVLREIVDDLSEPAVMSRLVQGDVGSGKTIVAVEAIVVVIENGYQAALMAPTEILAEQHFKSASRYLEKTGYRLALLSGRVRGRARKKLLEEVESGQIDLLVGTHALFQKGVSFKDLGLVVIDEQHRFGVIQRSQLMEKGEQTDTLVMTATPIPRSLAMTAYGDLDLSVIDELPPGRNPVQTIVQKEENRSDVYAAMRRQLEGGRQVYVVCPLVEQSEKMDLRAATEMAELLQKAVFPDYVVGLMHGRLKSEEKEALMQRFQKGEVHILVSTTVIEVGIDVANATFMLVEHADRFGLSQLHQLRGRIGRGEHAGYCILMVDGPQSKEAYERMEVMRSSSDGFKIAEKDLEIRGPGDFLGTRQSGMPTFLFGNIVRDRKWLMLAEEEAEKHLAKVKSEGRESTDRLLANTASQWKQRFGFFDVG